MREITSDISYSMMPQPEKPRLNTGTSRLLPIWFTNAMPGRDAADPWVMLVP